MEIIYFNAGPWVIGEVALVSNRYGEQEAIDPTFTSLPIVWLRSNRFYCSTETFNLYRNANTRLASIVSRREPFGWENAYPQTAAIMATLQQPSKFSEKSKKQIMAVFARLCGDRALVEKVLKC